jgi:rhamnosyltransferase
MMKDEVCAIVVTFRPDFAVRDNLDKIRSQVSRMIVVDNASPAGSLAWLRVSRGELAFELIENRENVGLPAALNLGIDRAIADGFEWIMLFDQDSTVTDSMIGRMLAEMKTLSLTRKIGIIAPRYVDRVTGKEDPATPPKLADGCLNSAYTSGSLVPASVFVDAGKFESALVIDLLDYEFSLRIRQKGYCIMQSDDAVLFHTPGFPKKARFLGIKSYTLDGHSPRRKYYRFRNRVWIVKRYWRAHPAIVWTNLKTLAKEIARILLGERHRWTTFRFIGQGIWDGLIGRMGKTVEL